MDPTAHILRSLGFLSYGIVSAAIASAAAYICGFSLTYLAKEEAYRTSLHRDVFQGLVISFPLAYLAWIVGYLSGFSRSGAVSDLVPAVLAFFGASAAILALRFPVLVQTAMIVVSFSTCLFIGTTLGSNLLAAEDENNKRLHLEYLKEQADVESVIKAYRENLGLEWPPNYTLPAGTRAN